MKTNVRVIDCDANGKTVVVKYKSGTVRYYMTSTIPDSVRNIIMDALKNPDQYECGLAKIPVVSGDERNGYKYSVKTYARVIVN